ncbi:MAG: hypothetical protein M0R22_03725 [Dehalococcoidia bacterium]|jgi:hypothetical protein|nr:hypothetical protein [Dehalococcoidia bacterium]
MSARNSDERLFSDDIERLLRGEETLPSHADAEYAETLRFARKLLALREEPRPEFTATLRDRLMTGMAEQDMAARQEDTRSWFARFFGQPGLRLAMVSTFVVLAAVGLLWKAGLFSMLPAQEAASAPTALSGNGLTPPATSGMNAPDALLATQGEEDAAAVARDVAPFIVSGRVAPTNAYGDTIAISLSFQNNGPEGMMLSPFPPEVSIRDVSNGQTVYTFAAGTSQLALSSMESVTYDVSWDQKDAGGTQVLPGAYEVDVQAIESRLEKGDEAESPVTQAVTSFEVLLEARKDTAMAADTPDS